MLTLHDKYKPFLFVLFISFISCNYSFATKRNVDIYGPLVDEITSSYITDMRKNYGMTCDLNGGSMPYDVEMIGLGFNGFKKLNIEEVRSLIVIWAEDLIKRFNSNIKIRPYLHNYPFTKKNISLMINFETLNGKKKYPVNPPYIAFVMLNRGEISYSLYDEENSYLTHIQEKDILIETYEEALKIESEK